MVTNNGVFGAGSADASGSWQPASLSDPVVQRVDQLVRSENAQISNGPLLKVESQNGKDYRLQYGIAENTDFQIVVTYNTKADSIFTVSSKTNSQSTYTIKGGSVGSIPVAPTSTDGFVPLPNYAVDPAFIRVDQYVRTNVKDLQDASIFSVRSSGVTYKIQYRISSG